MYETRYLPRQLRKSNGKIRFCNEVYVAKKHGIRQQLNTTVISCTLHRREAHWRVAQGAVRQVVYNYTEKALYSFKTEKESNIRINLLSLNRKGIVKNWLGYLLSVSLSIIKMKDYEKVSVHIVFIGRYQ